MTTIGESCRSLTIVEEMKLFFKHLFCWHNWSEWKEGKDKWASMWSIFAMPGSEIYDTLLVKKYKTRSCKKCGKFQHRSLGEYFERSR